MKIIVDGTNPENDDKLLYLTIMEVPDDVEVDRESYGDVRYTYVHGGGNIIEGTYVDVYDIGTQLAEFVVDLTYSADKLFQRASKAILDHYQVDGEVPEDDHYIVSIQQFYKELLNATGCEGVHWVYM